MMACIHPNSKQEFPAPIIVPIDTKTTVAALKTMISETANIPQNAISVRGVKELKDRESARHVMKKYDAIIFTLHSKL